MYVWLLTTTIAEKVHTVITNNILTVIHGLKIAIWVYTYYKCKKK